MYLQCCSMGPDHEGVAVKWRRKDGEKQVEYMPFNIRYSENLGISCTR